MGLGLGVAHRLTSALFWSSRNLKRIVFVLSCGRGASRPRSQTPRVRLVCRGWRQSPHLICQQAEQAARDGKVILVLSDAELEKGKQPIQALLATGAVHHHLAKLALRCGCRAG